MRGDLWQRRDDLKSQRRSMYGIYSMFTLTSHTKPQLILPESYMPVPPTCHRCCLREKTCLMDQCGSPRPSKSNCLTQKTPLGCGKRTRPFVAARFERKRLVQGCSCLSCLQCSPNHGVGGWLGVQDIIKDETPSHEALPEAPQGRKLIVSSQGLQGRVLQGLQGGLQLISRVFT